MSTPPRQPVPSSRPTPPARLSRKQQRRQELIDTKLFRRISPSRPGGAVVVMAAALALLWLVLGIDALLDHPLLELGIKPRRWDGLAGIVVAWVLHASAAQLAALSIPFAVLGWLMLTSGTRHLVLVTAATTLAGGLVDWLAGPADHVLVGVSPVLLGWLGYLLARALFGRRVVQIAIAVAVTVVFSGLFDALLPRTHQHEFWAGELAAFAVGAGLGALLHRRREPAGASRPPLVRRLARRR
ncbi:rhomboid family intramembrane serine protease [Jatrophihabitans sp.]|uniref:rhomboid family intramembrane serine protease n=1 Tax=Jatrophihabitans sp. TaxID=1932789 RepID=UPI002B5AE9E5|nr:rhomboid family intramembrane serine protease [Jatrophihabitans sp.]